MNKVFMFAIAAMIASCNISDEVAPNSPASLGFGGVTDDKPTVTPRNYHTVYIRLTNHTIINGLTKYDVEAKASVPGLRMNGMNVRLFVPANQFGWVGMTEFLPGYGPTPPHPAQVATGGASSGMVLFNIPGPARYINGSMGITDPALAQGYLDDWCKLFAITLAGIPSCPIVILDKEHIPANGSFFPGSNGLTVVVDNGSGNSFYAEASVTPYVNWHQTSNTMPYGAPIPCQ